MVANNKIIDHSGMTLRVANVEIAGTPSIESTVANLTITDDLTMGGDAVIGGAATADSLTFGGTTNVLSLQTYVATVTVLDGATTGLEAAIAMPNNFLPVAVAIHVTTAATNAVNITNIGDEGDDDSFVDTIAVAANSTGAKGIFSCNGLRGFPGGTANTGALGTADEVMLTLSGDPGVTGCTARLTFLGIVLS